MATVLRPSHAPETSPRPPSGAARWSWLRDALIVGLPSLLALGLCLYGITARSLGFDESATFAIVSQHGAALRHAIAHDGGNMSGYYVLLHALVGLFGSSVLVLRLPSAIGIALAVALTGMLALRLFDRRAALFAGVLTAISMPLVFWGQSARSYALLVAFVTGSFLAFVDLVSDGPQPRGRRALAWAGYVIATALGMYMSLMTVLVVIAQLLLVPWWKRHWRALGGAMVAIAVLCVPLMVLALGRGSSQLAWVSTPTLTDIDQVSEALTGAGLQPSMHATATTPVLLALTALILLACAVAIIPRLRQRSSFGPLLLLSWLAVPVAIAWAESLVGQPLFLPRNLIYSVPAVALLLAWGLTRPRIPALAGAACLVVLVGLRVLQLAPTYGISPEDWKGATAYVLHHTAPGDCALFYPSDGRMAFQYYLAVQPVGPSGGPRPRPVLPSTPWSRVRPFVEDYAVPSSPHLSQITASCPRLWFISSHQGRRHGSPAARTEYRHDVQLTAALQRAYSHHTTRLFGYASAVHVELLGP